MKKQNIILGIVISNVIIILGFVLKILHASYSSPTLLIGIVTFIFFLLILKLKRAP